MPLGVAGLVRPHQHGLTGTPGHHRQEQPVESGPQGNARNFCLCNAPCAPTSSLMRCVSCRTRPGSQCLPHLQGQRERDRSSLLPHLQGQRERDRSNLLLHLQGQRKGMDPARSLPVLSGAAPSCSIHAKPRADHLQCPSFSHRPARMDLCTHFSCGWQIAHVATVPHIPLLLTPHGGPLNLDSP